MKTLLGSELSPDQQRAALARFVHRYTGEHKPVWANNFWKDVNGEWLPYPLQFVDDADWLAHTRFVVTASRRHGVTASRRQVVFPIAQRPATRARRGRITLSCAPEAHSLRTTWQPQSSTEYDTAPSYQPPRD